MTLVGVDVVKGDRVEFVGDTTRLYRINSNHQFQVQHGEILEVTAVFTDTVNARTLGTREASGSWSTRNERITFPISRYMLSLEDPNRPVPPQPRRLGERPEDTEEMTHIGTDDPRIQWLFEDMGKYATDKGWCPEYDALCARLSIPGRPRDFAVNRTVNGVEFRTTVKARSQKEANELVDKALATVASA